MFHLTYKNQTFSNPSDFQLNIDSYPESIRQGLEFCKQWLEGTEEFEQQTSGSTGTPKKIRITRARMVASAKATQRFFNTDSNSQLLCCLDTGYIGGKMMLVRAMVWDCPIQLVEPSSNPLLEIADDHKIDFVAMVPMQVQGSLGASKTLLKLQSIPHIIIGGAPVSAQLKEELITKQIQAYQTYGMTETVSHIALAKINLDKLAYVTLPGVSIGVDERGALWVKSEMSGTAKIQTNDLVELQHENSFHWLGRADFVINSGGIKIQPEQLEIKISSTVEQFYPISEFFFFGLNDQKLGEKVVLFIESANLSKELLAEFKKAIKAQLSRFENPKEVHVLKEFVRTQSQKINKLQTSQRV